MSSAERGLTMAWLGCCCSRNSLVRNHLRNHLVRNRLVRNNKVQAEDHADVQARRAKKPSGDRRGLCSVDFGSVDFGAASFGSEV